MEATAQTQTVLFLPDDDVTRLLVENGIRLDQALRENGLPGARLTLQSPSDNTAREPITAIIIASTIGVAVLGSKIADIIRALSSGPVTVATEVVSVGADGSFSATRTEQIVQSASHDSPLEMTARLPLGIRVSLKTGGSK